MATPREISWKCASPSTTTGRTAQPEVAQPLCSEQLLRMCRQSPPSPHKPVEMLLLNRQCSRQYVRAVADTTPLLPTTQRKSQRTSVSAPARNLAAVASVVCAPITDTGQHANNSPGSSRRLTRRDQLSTTSTSISVGRVRLEPVYSSAPRGCDTSP